MSVLRSLKIHCDNTMGNQPSPSTTLHQCVCLECFSMGGAQWLLHTACTLVLAREGGQVLLSPCVCYRGTAHCLLRVPQQDPCYTAPPSTGHAITASLARLVGGKVMYAQPIPGLLRLTVECTLIRITQEWDPTAMPQMIYYSTLLYIHYCIFNS